MHLPTKLLIFSVLISLNLVAQEGNVVAKSETSSHKNSEVFSVQIQQNKYLLPLFGTLPKTNTEKAKDEEFVAMCKKNFNNLKEASQFFTDRGWDYITENEPDTAIHRFNLAYLLNPANAEAYWGLGVICYQRGEYDMASSILEKGMQADSSIADMVVDLAIVELSCYEKNRHQDDLLKAHRHLANAIEIEPSNISAWLKRAQAEYYLENYENAWECIHSARLLDHLKIDLIFLEKLNEKLIDPQGIYKF